MELCPDASTAACSPRTLSGRGVMMKGCLLMLDVIFGEGSIGSGSVPAATVSPAHAKRISARPRRGTICRTLS